MEGAASKTWQQIQLAYYKQKRIRKSSRKWIKGVLVQLHYMAWKQWNHRNKINCIVTKPQEALAHQLMDEEITLLLSTQMHELRPGDRHRLNRNLMDLLNKPFKYKKNWLANITSARQRYFRIKHNNAELIVRSKRASRLYQWAKGGSL